jgi:hypothetical protein
VVETVGPLDRATQRDIAGEKDVWPVQGDEEETRAPTTARFPSPRSRLPRPLRLSEPAEIGEAPTDPCIPLRRAARPIVEIAESQSGRPASPERLRVVR